MYNNPTYASPTVSTYPMDIVLRLRVKNNKINLWLENVSFVHAKFKLNLFPSLSVILWQTNIHTFIFKLLF